MRGCLRRALERLAPCVGDPRGHRCAENRAALGRPSTRGSGASRCGSSALRHRSSSNGAHSVPATCASASVWMPTGVASTGTSHASASSTASPKPSRSDGTSTALAALTHSGTRSGSTPPSAATPPRSLRERGRDRGASRRAPDRLGTGRMAPQGRVRAAPRACARASGRKRSRSTPQGSTARAGARGPAVPLRVAPRRRPAARSSAAPRRWPAVCADGERRCRAPSTHARESAQRATARR